jgi:hypothetical protein
MHSLADPAALLARHTAAHPAALVAAARAAAPPATRSAAAGRRAAANAAAGPVANAAGPVANGAGPVANGAGPVADDGAGAARGVIAQQAVPEYVATRLDQAGMLLGVPLAYLVPHPDLLPMEALRFFVIDPDWVAELRRGMLSAGSPEPVGPDAVPAGGDAGPPVSGLVLRSVLVQQYPRMAVRAWRGDIAAGADPDDPASGATPVPLLRADLLTPSVLLCLFASTPDLVALEEPHGSVRLGVRRDTAGNPVAALRHADGTPAASGGAPATVTVPFRGTAADGVLDVAALATALSAATAALPAGQRPPDPAATPSAFALQLLHPPARQRYSRQVGP